MQAAHPLFFFNFKTIKLFLFPRRFLRQFTDNVASNSFFSTEMKQGKGCNLEFAKLQEESTRSRNLLFSARFIFSRAHCLPRKPTKCKKNKKLSWNRQYFYHWTSSINHLTSMFCMEDKNGREWEMNRILVGGISYRFKTL